MSKTEDALAETESLPLVQTPSEWLQETNPPFTWLWEDKSSEQPEWRPFRRCDQKRLEAAEFLKNTEFVHLEGGRWKVNLKERLLVDSYGSDPPLKRCAVRRARWFLRPNTVSFVPYDEQVDHSIEQTYQEIIAPTGSAPVEGAEILKKVPLESGRTVALKMKYKSSKWRVSAEERATSGTSWVAYAQAALERVFQLQRGFGEVQIQAGEAEEEILGNDIGQVIILVHGIGEKMWSEEGCGLAFSSGIFRQLVHAKQLKSAGYEKRTDGSWVYPGEGTPSLKKDEVLEASWWETIHTDEMDARLQRISLPTMKQVRQIANFTVVDGIYYMHPKHQEKILEAVCKAVENAFQRFLEHHPSYQGPVVLAGHSLGGAILFHLLRSGTPKLSFTPLALFTMGSPTGLFVHTSDDVPSSSFALPGNTRFFNIFHPMDPVAYRMEPLIEGDLEKLDAEKIPVEGLWGGMKVHHQFERMYKGVYNWTKGEEKKQDELRKLCESIALNGGDRIDWALQEDMTPWQVAGVAGELMQALPSHSCYMKSEDVAAFVQSKTTLLAVAKAANSIASSST